MSVPKADQQGKTGEKWGKVPRAVTLDRDLSNAAYRLYGGLALYADGKTGVGYASTDTLAAVFGVKPNAVVKNLNELEARGHLIRGHVTLANGRKHKGYRLLADGGDRSISARNEHTDRSISERNEDADRSISEPVSCRDGTRFVPRWNAGESAVSVPRKAKRGKIAPLSDQGTDQGTEEYR